jgi:hypothetical protein
MNVLNQIEKENLIGTIDTEKKLINEECVNITNEKKWMKNCPTCNRIISYVNKYLLRDAINKKTICKSCRRHSTETKEKMSGKGNGMYGTHRYDTQNPFHGKHHTNEARRKMRIAACKRVLELQRNDKDGRINNVGLKEGKYFSQIEKNRRWDGVYYEKSNRQHLIENLGYFVDYYEPNLNIVIEYDEPRHYVYGNLKEKDIKRMDEIKDHLKCKFFRYNEYTKELKEY